MSVSKTTRYFILNISIGFLAYLVYKYYGMAMTQPRDGSKQDEIILLGIALIIAIGIVGVLRIFYKKLATTEDKLSLRGSEVDALGAVAANKQKPITHHLHVMADVYDELLASGKVEVAPEVFELPYRKGDTVQVSAGNGTIPTRITALDGVNQHVTLTRDTAAA